MNREPQPPLPDVERLIRESKEHTRKLNWWLRAHALFLTLSVLLTIWTLTRQASDWYFGRTVGYRLGGIHAPHYSRGEFEQEYLSRVRGRGFNVERMLIYRQTNLNQFDIEIFVRFVPTNVSDRDVLKHLQQVGESMKDKVLTVEPPSGP